MGCARIFESKTMPPFTNELHEKAPLIAPSGA